MDPTPYFIMGALSGVFATLAIQFFANRKVKRALAQVSVTSAEDRAESQQQRRETLEMHRRLIVLEKIVTDQPHRLHSEIDSLR
ncbi:hypothetical protein AB2M62_09555 [Sphingomonas sp. MMS12-HWE2-04]|uniref:hypothetical protein n=1 Tax=Sphingomonas sp. MMS12-HWE2-04 TaxID=3234199 RepID=UPI00384B2E7D